MPATGTPAQAPSGSENLTVQLGGVLVQGGFDELVPGTQGWVRPPAGTRVSVAEIYALAASLERLYAAAGYLLARVVVPPQTLVDGTMLRLRVIDGFIETIDLQRLPEAARAAVAARTAPLIGQRRLKLATVERQLLLAGDVPGLTLTSTLLPGSEEGGSRLVLGGGFRRVSGLIGFDNRLDASLGHWQLKGSLSLNGMLGFGEQLYGLAVVARPGDWAGRPAPLEVFGVGALVPLGDDGFSLNPEVTQSSTHTPATSGAPASSGRYSRLALRGNLALQRSRRENLNASLALEQVTQQLSAPDFGIDLSKDRYAVVRASIDFGATRASGNSWQLGATASRGLGGRTQQDAMADGVPLSRVGAEPEFNKLVLSLRSGHALPGQLHLGLIALGQTSFGQPLLRSEQFSLDGDQALSTADAGRFSVDRGATFRAELGRAWSMARVSVFPYLLAAVGRGDLVKPTVVEQATVHVHTLGLGVRGSLEARESTPGLIFALEWGRSVSDLPSHTAESRWMLSASLPF